MSFSIRQGNNDGFMRRISQLPAGINRAKRIALTRAGTEMQEKAVTWAPVKTGNLRRSITMRKGQDAVIVGTNLAYAPPHDRGSYIKPHTRTSAFGRATKPFQVKGRYQKAYQGRGYLTPSYLRMKTGRFRQIVHEEISAVLTRR